MTSPDDGIEYQTFNIQGTGTPYKDLRSIYEAPANPKTGDIFADRNSGEVYVYTGSRYARVDDSSEQLKEAFLQSEDDGINDEYLKQLAIQIREQWNHGLI